MIIAAALAMIACERASGDVANPNIDCNAFGFPKMRQNQGSCYHDHNKPRPDAHGGARMKRHECEGTCEHQQSLTRSCEVAQNRPGEEQCERAAPHDRFVERKGASHEKDVCRAYASAKNEQRVKHTTLAPIGNLFATDQRQKAVRANEIERARD